MESVVVSPELSLTSLAMNAGADTGVPLVMLHGLVSGNMATWYSSLASPLSADRTVVIYDQRGHGGSGTAATGFDLDSQASDLDAVLAHHGLAGAPVDLAGHSMGALIALRFALRHPGRVRRLALVDAPMPAGDFVGPSLLGAASPEALAAWLDSRQEGGLAGLAGRRRARMLQRLEQLLFASTLVADVLAMGSEPDDRLAALALPVLLVYGRQSPCLAAAAHLQQRLPDASLRLLDCGHYIPDEAPAELLAALRHFFTQGQAHVQT